MSEADGKMCVICGRDCANLPRIKDPRGRYYHKECYEDARSRRGGVNVAAIGTPDEALGPDDLLEPQHGFDLESIMEQVEPSRACPQCNAPLDAAAVICVKCGYNVHEGAPLAPPVVQRAPRASAPRMTVWPIVIGVISLLYAGLILLGAFVDIDDASPGFEGGVAQRVVSGAVAIWLGLSAVGVLCRSQRGAVWMLWWAGVQIGLSLVCGGVAVVGVAVLGDEIARQTGASAAYMLGALVGQIVIGLIWPVILVIWLRRPAIQRQIGEWR